MPFPDDFDADASGAYPSREELRAEARERQALRHRQALDRIDEAMDELIAHVTLLGGADEAGRIETDHAELIAGELEALVARHQPAIGGVL